jgi:solute carrier family 45 protein 1/2/4
MPARYLHPEAAQIDEQSVVGLAAAVLVVALNISIQPVQMSARAMVVEGVDRRWQTRASAWASYMTGAGNIVGYVCGWVGIEKVLDLPNLKHFQMLSLVASTALMTTVLINCSTIRQELCTRRAGYAQVGDRASSVIARLASIPRELFDCFNTVPQNIRKVFQIQFWAWMGWFPFLYYSTRCVV